MQRGSLHCCSGWNHYSDSSPIGCVALLTKGRVGISWSKFDCFTTCPLKFTLQYRERPYVSKDLRAFAVGSIVHGIMENWAKGGYHHGYVVGTVGQAFKRYAKKHRHIFLASDPRADVRELLTRTIKGAIQAERIYLQLGFPAHNAMVEHYFQIRMRQRNPSILFQGGIDVYDPERKAIFDLKLHRDAGGGNIQQLLTYAVALNYELRPVELIGFLYPLRKKKVDSTRITETQILEHRETLIRAAMDMAQPENLSREPRTGNHCFWCEYRQTPHCPATFSQPSSDEPVNARTRKLGF